MKFLAGLLCGIVLPFLGRLAWTAFGHANPLAFWLAVGLVAVIVGAVVVIYVLLPNPRF